MISVLPGGDFNVRWVVGTQRQSACTGLRTLVASLSLNMFERPVSQSKQNISHPKVHILGNFHEGGKTCLANRLQSVPTEASGTQSRVVTQVQTALEDV